MKKESLDLQTVFDIVAQEMDAVYLLDFENDYFKALKTNDMFLKLLGTEGKYLDLSRKLIFGYNSKDLDVANTYDVFLTSLNKIEGKYSRKRKFYYEDQVALVQMTVYPLSDSGQSVLLLTQIDSSGYAQEQYDREKENVITSTYLFSMYVDLNIDMCGSVSITELFDTPNNNAKIKYSQWRKDIVNMMYEDDKHAFLKYTDPIYLRNNLKVSRPISMEGQMMNLEGKFIWVKLMFKRIQPASEDDFRFVFMVQDIHDGYMKIQKDMKKYEELSSLDSLTGVYNHGRIEIELRQCIEKCRNKDAVASLFMFDIDYFKNVNDTHGHATGDYVLKTLMMVVREFFDGYNVSLGRWGGEEFIGICYDMSKDELFSLTQKLREKIAEYKFKNIEKLTCSFGITEISDGEDATGVFERLDSALYAAKGSGRDCVICA